MLFYVNRIVVVLMGLWLVFVSVMLYGLDIHPFTAWVCIALGALGAFGVFISLVARRENL